MEIAFFFAGMTRTASDQSISIGAASESLATAFAISSSVSASTRAQSVLPLRRSPHFRVMICSFFILPRASRRDHSDDIRSPRKDCCDQLAFQKTYRDPALLVVTIRFAKKNRSVEDPGCILEVDAMLVEIGLALVLVPLERVRREKFKVGVGHTAFFPNVYTDVFRFKAGELVDIDGT